MPNTRDAFASATLSVGLVIWSLAQAATPTAAYLGLAPTSKGYVAWVREGAAPQMRHAEPPPK